MLEDLKSLALKSDLFLSEIESQIVDHGDCIQVQTTAQPHYFWGNFLIFPKPPGSPALKEWKERYRQLFNTKDPGFYIFTWDVESKAPSRELIQGWERQELSCSVDITLRHSKPASPKIVPNLKVRKLQLEEYELIPQLHYNPASAFSGEQQLAFMSKRVEFYTLFQSKGLGERYGAFLGKELVGELGIYFQDGIARYNEIATHQEHYRKGICSQLVQDSARLLSQEKEVKHFVIVADRDYHAINAYKSLGFEEYQENYSLQWYDKSRY